MNWNANSYEKLISNLGLEMCGPMIIQCNYLRGYFSVIPGVYVGSQIPSDFPANLDMKKMEEK